ncbi:MAG: AAA family ATPase [Clostridia bacterium]|nr:AAA family ATPase [Clostridia bacterium]
MSETNMMNIPALAVSDAKRQLLKLYITAIEKGIPFKKLPTPFYWGSPGVGKSESVYQLADALSAKTGKKVNVTDVRLLLFSPVDLRGVPVADANREFTNWLKPKIFDMEAGEDYINILFLDELSAAPQSVQAAAYQICLDRKIGEHRLPDNCIVIAAGNRTTDRSVSYRMPNALANRLIHFNIISDFTSWKSWAMENGVSPKVIAYLSFDNTRLCVEPDGSDLAYPTPRSWAFVSTLLSTVDDDPEKIHSLISGCVGNDTAIEFESFCKGVLKMPCIDDIFAGKCKEYPKAHDVLYALITALAGTVYNRHSTLTLQELENVCRYVSCLPQDFVMVFMKDIGEIDGMNKRLMKCRSFQQWISKNKEYI